MFVLTEADATAIRTTFHEEGELSAIIELRQRFPGVADHVEVQS
jgi:RecB family exonuclease